MLLRRSSKSSGSSCPLRSRNEAFTLNQIIQTPPSEPILSIIKKKKQTRNKHISEKGGLRRLDFPEMDKINYFA